MEALASFPETLYQTQTRARNHDLSDSEVGEAVY